MKAQIISFSLSFQNRNMLTCNEEISVISNSDVLDRLGRARTEKN